MKILISACLLGEKCRYDGKTNTIDDEIMSILEGCELIPVCPEVDGGLGIPRIPSERIDNKVINRDGEDVTLEYQKGAFGALSLAREHNVDFCIMKESSPACGVNMIHDGNFQGKKIPGMGVASEILSKNGYTVLSEKQTEEIKRKIWCNI